MSILANGWRVTVCGGLILPISSFAADCAKPSIDLESYNLELACIHYAGKNYRAELFSTKVSGAALAWQLDASSLGTATCDVNQGGCASISNDLTMNIGQLDIGGQPYSVVLDFVKNPADPTNYYWQYRKHYAEQASTPSATVTSTEDDSNNNPPGPSSSSQVAYKTYDVRVSYYDTYANAISRKAAIENNIYHFADAVYEASNGAQRLGKVSIYTDAAYADNADIVWVKSCWPNAHVAGRGEKGARVEHCDSFEGTDMLAQPRFGGYTLLHEWGHFFYGLYDEYKNDDEACGEAGAPCKEDVPVDKSAMNNTDNGLDENDNLKDATWLNFSTALTNSAPSNAQFRVHQASGWDTLLRNPEQDPTQIYRSFYPELKAVAPSVGKMPSLEINAENAVTLARSELKISFKPGSANTTRRAGENSDYVPIVRQLLVDTSSAMSKQDLEAIKATLQSIIDRSEIGDSIGIMDFASEARVIAAPRPIQTEEDKDNLIAVIENLQLSQQLPAMGNALESALIELEAANLSEDSNWAVFLFSAGKNLTGLAPSPVIRAYRDEEVMLLAFITGNQADDNLRELSENTDGGYWLIPDLDELPELVEEAEAEASPIVDVLIAGDYRDIEGSDSFSFYLDESLSEVEISLNYFGVTDDASLALVDPNGNTVATEADGCGDVIEESDVGEIENFCYFEVVNPEAGNWQIQIDNNSLAEVEYRVAGFPKDNAESYFSLVDIPAGEYASVGESVLVHAMVGDNLPMTDVSAKASLEHPDGSVTELLLRDDGVAPDAIANDGEYSTSFDANTVGDYFIIASFDNSAGTAKSSNYGVAYIPTSSGNTPARSLTPVSSPFQRIAYKQVIVE